MAQCLKYEKFCECKSCHKTGRKSHNVVNFDMFKYLRFIIFDFIFRQHSVLVTLIIMGKHFVTLIPVEDADGTILYVS